MALLGKWNWYLPRWLRWLPKIDVEGHDVSSETVVIPDTPEELVRSESRD